MNIDKIKDKISNSQGFENHIGMEFLSTPEADQCVARMVVDKRNMQPFGMLSGGATIALCETLAGVGSASLCPDAIPVGMNVNANHIHPARQGETVTATAYLKHCGRQTHLWQVEVFNDKGIHISSVSVTNFILSK